MQRDNLGQLELLALQGHRELTAPKEMQDRKVIEALMVLRGPRDSQAPQEMLDCRAVSGHRELLEPQVPQDNQDSQGPLVPLDLPGRMDK